MKKLITCLTAGLLVIGAQSLKAQSSTNSTPATPADGVHHRDANPEQRKERMAKILKMLDLTPADMKSLSPEERQAKIKTAADKKIAELKAKKAAGTLSDEDQKNLDHLEKFAAHNGHKKATDQSNN